MSQNKNDLLNKAKNLLEEEMSPISFMTWIKPLEIYEMTDHKIVFLIKAPRDSSYITIKISKSAS